MSGYIPPALRDSRHYKPKKLTFRAPIDYTNRKTKEEVLEEYHKIDYGKADGAWDSPICDQSN